MARDISELGADVFDDTPRKPRKISPRKRNYIIGLSITGALLVGAVTASIILCNTALTDYANVENVIYYFTQDAVLEEGQKPYAVLYRLPSDRKFPSTFRIPSQVMGYKVLGVADRAFSGHNEIKKVVMTNNIQFVGEEAFANCENLASFTWSKNLNDVGVGAFENTKFYNTLQQDNKTLYDLPSGLLIYVGKEYFDENTALVSDSLSEAEINDIKANYTVDNITKFSDLNVKGICSGAFKENNRITYIDLPEALDDIPISTFESCKNLEGLDGTHSKLTLIANKAFANCTDLKKASLPATLTTLGDEVFVNTGLIDSIPELSHISNVGERIFADCKQLKTINYTANKVYKYMFEGCSKLETVTFGEDNANLDNVTEIARGAFKGTAIKEITLPKQLSEVSDFAFQGCDKLEKVYVWGNFNDELVTQEEPEQLKEGEEHEYPFVDHDGNPCDALKGIQTVKESAFENCTSLTTIKLYDYDNENHIIYEGNDGDFTFPYSLSRCDGSSLESTTHHTFENTQPTNIIFSPNMKHIGSYAFAGADTLVSVSIQDFAHSKLTTIKANAFEDCANLETFDLAPTVARIEGNAFKGCQKLQSLDIGHTKITVISAYAFYDCQTISEIVIPETVTSIKSNAFFRNYNVDYVIVPAKVKEILKNAFTQCRANATDPKLQIFIERTVSQAYEGAGKINFGKPSWHDDTAEHYFLLGEGEEKQEGYNYWRLNEVTGEPEVI